jgi:hypothetical protein
LARGLNGAVEPMSRADVPDLIRRSTHRLMVRRALAANYGMLAGKGAEMNQRLWFSVALIAVLFCLWLVLSKPMCRDGLAASFGTRSGWICVADHN